MGTKCLNFPTDGRPTHFCQSGAGMLLHRQHYPYPPPQAGSLSEEEAGQENPHTTGDWPSTGGVREAPAPFRTGTPLAKEDLSSAPMKGSGPPFHGGGNRIKCGTCSAVLQIQHEARWSTVCPSVVLTNISHSFQGVYSRTDIGCTSLMFKYKTHPYSSHSF